MAQSYLSNNLGRKSAHSTFQRYSIAPSNDGGGRGYTEIESDDKKERLIHAGGGGYGTKGTHLHEDYYHYKNNDPDSDYIGHWGGKTYGNPKLNTLYLGSGGGSFNPLDGPAGYGGNGGGALWLKCGGTLTMRKNSKISCNGQVAPSYESGSGSGGSIHLLINDIQCLKQHEAAMIEARGGYKGKHNSNGGYGRIRVEFMGKGAQKSMDKEVKRQKPNTRMFYYEDCNFVPEAWVTSNMRLGDMKLSDSK